METALKGMPVFVTGATGFIGRRLVEALAAKGADVTVLSRSRAAGRDLPQGIQVLAGNLGDREVLDAGLQGKAVLFNLAYDVRAPASDNLDAFDTMLAAAKAARIQRIVHLSSIVVYDAWPDADCDESGPMDRSGGSAYRQAKIAMERRLQSGDLPAAILQPTIVYGPGSSLWTDGFAEALLAGGVILPEPEGLCNGVYVDDVVQACLRASTLPDLGRERFVISGPEPFAWSALLKGYAERLGRGEVRHVPLGELQAALGPEPTHHGGGDTPSLAAKISAVARRLIGHKRFEQGVRLLKRRLSPKTPLQPDHHLLSEFSGRGLCRIDHAQQRLGYAPEFDLARGLDATADHLRRIAG